MKDYEQMEELINSFVDGELDERKSNEVKRLIDNDQHAHKLYDSVISYKKLINSIRPSAAPEGFAESVKRNLERDILLADSEIYQPKKGQQRLVLRHFLTAAAMLALVAVLSYIIFDISVPQTTRTKLADNIFHRIKKPQIVTNVKPSAPPFDKAVQIPKGPTVPLVAKLTLTTESPVETDWLIGKALMNTGLFEKASGVERKSGSVKYSISCDRKAIANLMQELAFIWPKCSDAVLEVGTEQQGKFVKIDNVSSRQALDICKADSFNQRIRIANDVAAINQSADTDILRNYFAGQTNGSELLMPDKPALTSTEKSEPQTVTTDPAHLTITVIGK